MQKIDTIGICHFLESCVNISVHSVTLDEKLLAREPDFLLEVQPGYMGTSVLC
jgi:hypothetical protein